MAHAALLRCGWLLAGVIARGGHAAGVVAAEQQRSASSAIPDWKLQQVLGTGTSANSSGTGSSNTQGDTDASSAPWWGSATGFGSTEGQDSGRCPVMKLPSQIGLSSDTSSWVGQGGAWQTSNDVVLSSFKLNFLSQSWGTTHIRNLDQQEACRATVTSDEELSYLYGWKGVRNPMDYPAISNLENKWWKALWSGAYTVMKSPGQKYAFNSFGLWHVYSLLDCEGRLLFVVKVLQQDTTTIPGTIDIYDRVGMLVAHAMPDFKVAKYQFVDTNGYMLARAEAPGLGVDISLADLPTDPFKGNILPYEIQFEQGGYANASRLLDTDYRWVLAAAVQMRALDDAHRDWSPWAPKLMIGVYWTIAALVLVSVCCACGAIYRIVYPSKGSSETVPIFQFYNSSQQAGAGQQLWSYTASGKVV